jgi:hypothetical protein
MEAEYKAGKEVQIQLARAVALENNRGSIAAAQKRTKTTGTGLGSGSETELVNALATATNAVSTAADVLASSPPTRRLNPQLRRQLFTQSQSSPAPEPAKKNRKGRLLVEEHGEVDMGPRKLRSRK